MSSEPLLRDGGEGHCGKKAKKPKTKDNNHITPITVYEAGRRVGTLLDLWRSNPEAALHCFTKGLSKSNVLRGLFNPPRKSKGEASESHDDPDDDDGPDDEDDEIRLSFQQGDQVYARLGPIELKKTQRATREKLIKKMGISIDAYKQREWYMCQVKSCADGKYTVVCPSLKGYCEKAECKLEQESLKYAGRRDDATMLDVVQKKRGKNAHRMTMSEKVKLSLMVALGIMGLQLYSTVFLDRSCEDEDAPCAIQNSLGSGGAGFIGVACFAGSALMYWLLLPKAYMIFHGMMPVMAKRCRQLVITMSVDPVISMSLPNLAGRGEEIALVAYAAIISSFAIFACLLADVGVMAFGVIVGQKFLFACNLRGVRKSVMHLREKRFFDVAESLRRRLPIRMTSEQLALELKTVLAHEADNELMEISPELLLLLAVGTKVEQPDSIRLRYLAVKKVYVSDYSDKPRSDPSNFKRSDVVIDLFADTVEVPGVVLDPEVERWMLQGSKFFWHMCMNPGEVMKFELELRKMGMRPGDGCFSWRADEDSRWAANECRSWAGFEQCVARASQEKEDIGASLFAAVHKGKEEACKMLLEAKADPNYKDVIGDPVIHEACTSSDRLPLLRMLLQARADPDAIPSTRTRTCLMKVCAAGKADLAKELLAARADVTRVTKNNRSAMSGAMKKGNMELVKLLESNGARPVEGKASESSSEDDTDDNGNDAEVAVKMQGVAA